MSNINLQKQDFNFFSHEIYSKRSTRKRSIQLGVMVLIFLMLIAGVYFYFEYAIHSAQEQIDSLDEFLASEEVDANRRLVAEKKQEINELKRHSAALKSFLENIQRKDIIGTEYINQLTSAIPQGLFFESITLTTEQIHIQGTAPNRQIIAEYLNNMQALELFQDVHVPSITTISEEEDNEQGEYSFVMTCILKDVMEE
jgi:type IV pilus assembly protein PilN